MFCDNDQVETHLLLSLSLSNDLKLRQNQLLSPAPLPGTSTSTTASISLSTITAGFIFFQENNAKEVYAVSGKKQEARQERTQYIITYFIEDIDEGTLPAYPV